MNTEALDNLIRDTASSLCIRFGTSAPYAFGRTDLLSKGFGGGVQFVAVAVDCPERDISSIIPIARQVAASYLGEHGFGLDAVMICPMVMSRTWYYGGRREGLFTNENESAECGIGKRKRGARLWIAFELEPNHPVRQAVSFMGDTAIGKWKDSA